MEKKQQQMKNIQDSNDKAIPKDLKKLTKKAEWDYLNVKDKD